MTPGIEPINKVVSKLRSTDPRNQWPMPAARVSGTACAISDPTMRATGILGYRSRRTVTPMAPAPTDVSVTRTPIAAPRKTVNHGTDTWSSLLIRSAYLARTLLTQSRKVEVNSRTPANVKVISWGNFVPLASKVAKTASVAAVAGTLPVARRPTRRQSIVLVAPWTSVPTVFVDAANRRSVPTAVAG